MIGAPACGAPRQIAVLRPRVVFVSNCWGPWGGSEELWSRTALDLVAQGFPVSAIKWSPPHRRMLDLGERGVEVWSYPPRWRRAWRKLTAPDKSSITLGVQKMLMARPADIVVLANEGAFPPIDLLELCVSRRLPFVTIAQANSEQWWLDDVDAERYRIGLASALKCYFVSKANLRLAEKQIGCELSNAEVVWNPVNVDLGAVPPWPQLGRDGELHLACVARLDPKAKGQDILFEVLAGPAWEDCICTGGGQSVMASNGWLGVLGSPIGSYLQGMYQSQRSGHRITFL